jgi:hypothetical protein
VRLEGLGKLKKIHLIGFRTRYQNVHELRVWLTSREPKIRGSAGDAFPADRRAILGPTAAYRCPERGMARGIVYTQRVRVSCPTVASRSAGGRGAQAPSDATPS